MYKHGVGGTVTHHIQLATGTEHRKSQRGQIRKGACLICTSAIQLATFESFPLQTSFGGLQGQPFDRRKACLSGKGVSSMS